MASSMGFPLFAKLPPELRIFIWEISILEHHRDRFVPMNELTKRIICIRNLACSPHFRATWESRKVATDLYPIRLPVSWVVAPRHEVERVDDNMETDISNYPSKGAVYISTDHDIFISSFNRVAHWYRADHRNTLPTPDGEKFGWRTPSLSLSQCQGVRHIMLFNITDDSLLKDGCHRTPDCVIRCDAMDYYNIWYDTTVFSGVQRFLYAVLDESIMREFAIHFNILEMSGHSILENLEQKRWLACFDAETVKKHQAEGNSLECVCVTRQARV
ncbi:hypothetical protein F4823DRAFT_573834 [Ustulina deusta]|nr:hypothetical protein F4823DRAFT_573834 [Ustulina deusta]